MVYLIQHHSEILSVPIISYVIELHDKVLALYLNLKIILISMAPATR